MDSSFRLLVYAVAAAVVVSLVYFVMLPFLFPIPNNILIIERTLEASEAGLGKGFFDEVTVQEGEGFSGQTFDNKFRNAAFQCNSAAFCCPQTEECNLAIEWDNRSIRFNESRTVLVTTRCDLQYGLYACTVYLGEEPAQIEIESVEAPKEVDLSKEMLSFDIVFANTGNQETQQTEVRVEIFQRYLEEGKWVERAVEEALAIENFGPLKPGQKMQKTIFVNLNQNGSLKAKIRVSGLEAGFDEKIFQFTATGAAHYCEPYHCSDPSFLGGKCVARCHCTGCMLGSKCAEALLQSDPVDLGLRPEVTFENAETSLLGSNEVDVILLDKFCPGDIVIEEPNAVSNIIGFKVKNIGESPVQKRFIVEAFLGEQELGSVQVEPDEINDKGYVIKAISVELDLGTYSVKLIANRERTEMEKSYKNNEANVVVEIIALEKLDVTPTEVGLCCGYPMGVVENRYLIDDSDAVLLRDVLTSGKVKADFKAKEFNVAFSIQNMTNKDLKIKIPFGQIFVSRDPTTQNLVKGQNYPPIQNDIVIEVPVCSVSTGSFSGFCLNRKKLLPDGLCNVGRVIEDPVVLSALGSGTGQEAQGRVWNAVEKQFSDPNNYGSGSYLIPDPLDLLGGVPLTKEQCIEAGSIEYNCALPIKPFADPDDVTLYNFYCTIP